MNPPLVVPDAPTANRGPSRRFLVGTRAIVTKRLNIGGNPLGKNERLSY
jgi:hypothetical protein